MIIHSTTLDTMEKVIAIYGGTKWAKIEGRFLLGQSSSYAINSTGGEAMHTLTTNETPIHTHTFTGTEVNSGTQSANHTHGIPALSGSASGVSLTGRLFNFATQGTTGVNCDGIVTLGTEFAGGSAKAGNTSYTTTASALDGVRIDASHSHTVTTNANNTGVNSVGHVHAVTAKGSNGATGGGQAHNNMPPFKTVYIWERTA